jgi:Cysteine-rich CPCC
VIPFCLPERSGGTASDQGRGADISGPGHGGVAVRMPPLDGPPGSYEICPVCFWDDDLVQLRWPTYAGGANQAPSPTPSTATSRMRGAEMATRATPPGPLANGMTPDESPKRSKAQRSEIASDLGLHGGADDGNRTRTVSLGS